MSEKCIPSGERNKSTNYTRVGVEVGVGECRVEEKVSSRALGQVNAIECDLLVQLTGYDDWPIALGTSDIPIFTAHSRKRR